MTMARMQLLLRREAVNVDYRSAPSLRALAILSSPEIASEGAIEQTPCHISCGYWDSRLPRYARYRGMTTSEERCERERQICLRRAHPGLGPLSRPGKVAGTARDLQSRKPDFGFLVQRRLLRICRALPQELRGGAAIEASNLSFGGPCCRQAGDCGNERGDSGAAEGRRRSDGSHLLCALSRPAGRGQGKLAYHGAHGHL